MICGLAGCENEVWDSKMIESRDDSDKPDFVLSGEATGDWTFRVGSYKVGRLHSVAKIITPNTPCWETLTYLLTDLDTISIHLQKAQEWIQSEDTWCTVWTRPAAGKEAQESKENTPDTKPKQYERYIHDKSNHNPGFEYCFLCIPLFNHIEFDERIQALEQRVNERERAVEIGDKPDTQTTTVFGGWTMIICGECWEYMGRVGDMVSVKKGKDVHDANCWLWAKHGTESLTVVNMNRIRLLEQRVKELEDATGTCKVTGHSWQWYESIGGDTLRRCGVCTFQEWDTRKKGDREKENDRMEKGIKALAESGEICKVFGHQFTLKGGQSYYADPEVIYRVCHVCDFGEWHKAD